MARLSGGTPTLRIFLVRGDQLEDLPGIGEKMRAEFGELVTAEIADYLKTNSRVAFE